MKITYEQIKNNPTARALVGKADEAMFNIGYTEHSLAHVVHVADVAQYILLKLGYSEREAELARIAGYLHDIGNIVNRTGHAQSGAVMAYQFLSGLGADVEDIADIVTAIGNHDEGSASPVTPIAAALIIADKTDVRRSRVRNVDPASFDIHDRVNYSVQESVTEIDHEHAEVLLRLQIDTRYCSVMDYFEIFMERMLLCRRAAEKLDLEFHLDINGQRMV